MRTVEQIYQEYRIMPGLQMHQLRVAAVGKSICDSLDAAVDTRSVVLASLFHDMGNILKSDLTVFPEFLGSESQDYWQHVKRDYIEKYGPVDRDAALSIARELGLEEKVITIIASIGFSRMESTRDTGTMEQKITEYADSRVAPHGVMSLRGRLEDARRRYHERFENNDIPAPDQRWQELASAAADLERQIFSSAKIQPQDITDASIESLVEELKHFQVA